MQTRSPALFRASDFGDQHQDIDVDINGFLDIKMRKIIDIDSTPVVSLTLSLSLLLPVLQVQLNYFQIPIEVIINEETMMTQTVPAAGIPTGSKVDSLRVPCEKEVLDATDMVQVYEYPYKYVRPANITSFRKFYSHPYGYRFRPY